MVSGWGWEVMRIKILGGVEGSSEGEICTGAVWRSVTVGRKRFNLKAEID